MVFTGNGVFATYFRVILGVDGSILSVLGSSFDLKRVFLRYFNAKLMGGVARVF